MRCRRETDADRAKSRKYGGAGGQGTAASVCVGFVSTDRLSSRLPCVPVPEGGGPGGAASGHSAEVSETDLADLAQTLAACAGRGDVIALSGPLGAGKTTFARHFIRSYAARRGGTAGEVPSPTFTLVQLYSFGADTVWHIDLYRIVSEEELWEIGFEEALAGGICLIEWPERAGNGCCRTGASTSASTIPAIRSCGACPWKTAPVTAARGRAGWRRCSTGWRRSAPAPRRRTGATGPAALSSPARSGATRG